jgi:hypothetical protein
MMFKTRYGRSVTAAASREHDLPRPHFGLLESLTQWLNLPAGNARCRDAPPFRRVVFCVDGGGFTFAFAARLGFCCMAFDILYEVAVMCRQAIAVNARKAVRADIHRGS